MLCITSFLFSVLLFDEDVEELILEIEILFDEEKEIRESFTVRLDPDQNMISELGVGSRWHGC